VSTRPKESVIELRSALEIQLNNPIIHQTLAMALRRTGDIPGATAEFKLAQQETDQENNHTAAVRDTNTGIASLRKGDVQDAIKELRSAVASEPDFADANHYLGIALSADTQYRAAREYKIAINLRPSHPMAHGALADAMAHLGDPAASKSELVLAREYGTCQLAGGH
jgi:Tfp pilus assembly protein PilF